MVHELAQSVLGAGEGGQLGGVVRPLGLEGIELRFDLVEFIVDEGDALLSLKRLRLEIELVYSDPFFHFLLL